MVAPQFIADFTPFSCSLGYLAVTVNLDAGVTSGAVVKSDVAVVLCGTCQFPGATC